MFAVRKTVRMIIDNIEEYLERHKRDYITDEFAYSSYYSPNTMYQVSNDLDEILLTLSPHAVKLWHYILMSLKRNKDAHKACQVNVTLHDCITILSKNYYYKALQELLESTLIYATTTKHLYVVNVIYANKLYKPKFDI